MSSRQFRQTPCTNCGILGHHFRNCTEPITSYGIIAFRVHKLQQMTLLKQELPVLDPNEVEFLCIQRKDSIGYVELIRSKYKCTELDYIREQISGITAQEKLNLQTMSFLDLWTGLWGPMTAPENRQYRQEFDQARVKFEAFRNGIEIKGQTVSLIDLLNESSENWPTPEWGFPKGRRNPQESDLGCAIREFCEETGIHSSQIHIFHNCAPIRETFRGNNDVRYCHVYYLALIPDSVSVQIQPGNVNMIREIGNIRWCSYKQAMTFIRPSNPEKRKVLQQADKLLRNTLPLLIGPMAIALSSVQNEASVLIRSGVNHGSNRGTQQFVWGANKQFIRIQDESQQQQQHDNNTENEWISRTTKPRDRYKRGTFSFVED